jgi:DNA-binding transcriptional MerR regulator
LGCDRVPDMKMRDLEQRTGVHRETIRVYIREGLLPQPARPKSNVADYGEAHVAALKAIQELKAGRQITVPQIKRALGGDPGALPSDPAAFSHLDALLAARLGVNEGLVPAAKLAASHPQAARDIVALTRIGAISPVKRGGVKHLTQPDAQIVMLWGQMRAAGFNEARGFTPEILTFYVEAADALAEREVSEFLEIVAGRATEAEATEMAQAATSLMLPFFGHLRMKAVVRAFRKAAQTKRAGAKAPARKKVRRVP